MTIILSIKPYYLYLILIGKKTIELRKSFPGRKEWDKTAFLYCTKDMKSFAEIPEEDQGWMRDKLGKIACKIVCDKIETIEVRHFTVFGHENRYCSVSEPPDNQWLAKSCLAYDEVVHYGKLAPLYGWHISFIFLFEPREITEFVHASVKFGKVRTATMRKESPPRSWCYALEVI